MIYLFSAQKENTKFFIEANKEFGREKNTKNDVQRNHKRNLYEYFIVDQ